MSIEISDSVRAVLATYPLATLVTLNPDGSPQLSAVNVVARGDEILIAHRHEYVKIRNIRRDPRVSLSILTGTRHPELGWPEYILIRGKAHVTEGGAVDLINEIQRFHTGNPDFADPEYGPEDGFQTHIEVERISGVGLWSITP